MVKMILCGCRGHMGRVITELAGSEEELKIVAGIDPAPGPDMGYPVFASFAECTQEADVIVDFSSPKVFDSLVDYACEKKTPAVVCTTGLTKEQTDRLDAEAARNAFLRSANMSLGINLLMSLLKDAVKTLGPAGFDVEIVEQHHNLKKDAPSGTALALADSINEAAGGQYEYIYDRSGRSAAREKKELGISAVRGGTISGIHEVIFAGTQETITFTHTAYSKAVFARGALQAAKFLAGKAPGMYSMADVIAASK